MGTKKTTQSIYLIVKERENDAIVLGGTSTKANPRTEIAGRLELQGEVDSSRQDGERNPPVPASRQAQYSPVIDSSDRTPSVAPAKWIHQQAFHSSGENQEAIAQLPNSLRWRRGQNGVMDAEWPEDETLEEGGTIRSGLTPLHERINGTDDGWS
ncbi:uncharacterized protein KD926_000978 [Aspergillus affinis]|uniref:uncharacterized protein n=1 Tax=Aspergillus affinis TaxID=1070780 RepID=UPI0022FE105A|nr:uncharacterized protein KD926_000978 [Aspergillus affinis]KAI9044377.1 hypothetical protein KD926_000978 [Aspergillus affinis]